MPDDALPRFADIRTIARRLSTDPKYSRTETKLKKAVVAQSCLSDMMRVSDILDLRRAVSQFGMVESTKYSLDVSLFVSAVVFYARAISTSLRKDGDRGSIYIKERLSSDEQIMHEAVLEVRNKAVAHVYPDQTVAGDIFHESVAVAAEQEGRWLPAIMNRQVYDSRPIWIYLEELVPVATKILRSEATRKLDEVIEIFNRAGVPYEWYENALIDLVSTIGSEAAVRNLLPGSPGVAYQRRKGAFER